MSALSALATFGYQAMAPILPPDEKKKIWHPARLPFLVFPSTERLLKTTHVPTHDVPAIGAFGQRLHLRSPRGVFGARFCGRIF